MFVKGEPYIAEQFKFYDRTDSIVWGNTRGINSQSGYKEFYGCLIAKYVLNIDDDSYNELYQSVCIAPNHSAILPLEA